MENLPQKVNFSLSAFFREEWHKTLTPRCEMYSKVSISKDQEALAVKVEIVNRTPHGGVVTYRQNYILPAQLLQQLKRVFEQRVKVAEVIKALAQAKDNTVKINTIRILARSMQMVGISINYFTVQALYQHLFKRKVSTQLIRKALQRDPNCKMFYKARQPHFYFTSL